MAPDCCRASPRSRSTRRVLAFTIGVAVATGVAFGLVPALPASRPDLHDALKDGTRGTTSGRGRLRKALVVAEVALSLVLLVGTGLMVRSFLRLRDGRSRLPPDHALTLQRVAAGRRQQASPTPTTRASSASSTTPTRACASSPASPPSAAATIMPLTGNTHRPALRHRGLHAGRQRPTSPTASRARSSATSSAPWASPSCAAAASSAERRRRRRRTWPSSTRRGCRSTRHDRDRARQRIRASRRSRNANPPWATIVGVIGDVRGYGLDAPARSRDVLAAGAGAATRRCRWSCAPPAIRRRSSARRARRHGRGRSAAADLRRQAARQRRRRVAGAAPLHADPDAAVRPGRARARRRRHLRRHGLHRRAADAGDRHPRRARRHAAHGARHGPRATA